jgi:hypothetical protein
MTLKVALVAMAASTAEPPAFRISTPASDARACGHATMPRGASVGGRPVSISIMVISSCRTKTPEQALLPGPVLQGLHGSSTSSPAEPL